MDVHKHELISKFNSAACNWIRLILYKYIAIFIHVGQFDKALQFSARRIVGGQGKVFA